MKALNSTIRQRYPQRMRRHSGFTLIEVMVALAIFVIGAIAIVRIFPPAFGVIQGSELRAIGTRMSQTTLARLTSEPGLMPDATYNPSVSPYTSPYAGTSAIAVVGSSSRNFSVPNSVLPSAFTNSALDKFRNIVGERHKIQTEAATPGQRFVLTQYPFSNGNVAVYREDQVNGVKIHTKADFGGIPSYVDGELDFSNATLASDPSVSFSDPSISNGRFPPADMRIAEVTYYVSYRWIEQGEVQGVIDEPIQIVGPVPSTVQVRQGLRLASQPATTHYVLPGSVSVRFRYRIATNPTPIAANDNIRGYVPISVPGTSGPPLSPLTTIRNPLQSGDTVNIDYQVDDWRWIVHDDIPNKAPALTATPTPAPPIRPFNVVAPVRPIDDSQPMYSLLSGTDISPSPSTTTGFKTLVRGSWVSGTGSGSIQNIDFKTGRVTYDIAPVDSGNIRGPRARVVYRTLDGWAHQLSVAARSYIPYDTTFNTTPREPWREYYWQGVAKSNQLFFRPSEAGKSIMVSFRYGPTAGVKRDVVSILTINDNVGELPPGLTGFGETKVASVIIADESGTAVSPTELLSIKSVQGVGVLARSAWIDQARYQQAAVASYRSVDQL